MNTYPRTWVLRHGPDAGRVLIAFSARGPLLLVGADGAVSWQYRVPAAYGVRELVLERDGAA